MIAATLVGTLAVHTLTNYCMSEVKINASHADGYLSGHCCGFRKLVIHKIHTTGTLCFDSLDNYIKTVDLYLTHQVCTRDK